MFISKAFAAAETAATDVAAPGLEASPWAAFASNMGLVLILVLMFYVLLIRPQQRRFKEHGQMLSGLKKGDKIITGGGLVGTIDKLIDENEVVIDLGNGLKVTALRSTIQSKDSPLLSKRPANDQKDNKEAKQ